MTVVFIVLGALVIGGAWYTDVRLRPWKPCPWCNGRTRTKGSRPTAYGKHHCRRCGGKGEVRRWGAGEGRLWTARTAAGITRAAGARAPGRSRSGTPRPRRGRRRTAAGAVAPGASDGDQGAPCRRWKGAVMGWIKKAAEKLTEPKERGGVMMYDCPLCPALFRSAEKAASHFATCRGE